MAEQRDTIILEDLADNLNNDKGNKSESTPLVRSWPTDTDNDTNLKPTKKRSSGGRNYQAQAEPMSFSLIMAAYDRVYFTAALRAQEDFAKLHNQPLKNREKLRHKTTKQRVCQFLGLPSGDSTDPITILKRLAGWNSPTYSTSRNVLQALIIFPVNLVLTASKLALNIVKLGTEFLPYVLAKGSLGLFNTCTDLLSDVAKAKSADRSLGWALDGAISLIGSLLFGILTAAFHIVYFIGGATTSPAENFRAAYRAGKELAGDDVLNKEGEKLDNSKVGKLVGGIFAAVSALTTACVYAVLFPLAIHALITQAPAVLPAIANSISQFIGIFSVQAGASTAAFFTTTLPAALASFGAMISGLFEPLIIGLSASAAIGAAVATPLVVAIDERGETKMDNEGIGFHYAEKMIVYYDDFSNTQKKALERGEENMEDALKKKVLVNDEDKPYKPYYKPVFPKLPEPELPDCSKIGEGFRNFSFNDSDRGLI